MQDIRYKDVVYEYRGYTYGRYQPKKNEITASAMYFLKEFIRIAGSEIKMEDWLLTKRQNQIMALMSDGKDKQEISNILGVGISTIASQIVDIYSRYGLCGDYKNSKAVVMFLRNTGRLE